MTSMETDGGGEGGEELPRKKLSGKKIILFVVLPLLLVLGGGAGLYFSGLLDGLLGKKKAEEHEEEKPVQAEEQVKCSPTPVFFTEFPEILVNLNTGERRPAFLKLNLSLEICRLEDVPALTQLMPRVLDSFQVYLRELKTDDLRGSAGIYRLREELLMRINTASHPIKVKDVLIKEFLVQ